MDWRLHSQFPILGHSTGAEDMHSSLLIPAGG